MRRLALFALTALGLAALLLLLATDAAPDLPRGAALSPADLVQGRALLASLGPRRPREGETRQLVLRAADLQLGVNYLAQRLGGRAAARIERGELDLRASLPVPGLPRHLNLRVRLAQRGAMLAPTSARLGALPLPAGLSAWLLDFILARSPYAETFAAARAVLDSARLQGDRLVLRFTWRAALVERAMAGAAEHGLERAALDAYRAHLAKIGGGDLAVLLGEAFSLAQRRSRGNDPVRENRAALAALAERALGMRLPPRPDALRKARGGGFRLAGRVDLAQHFALSAYLAASGGADLADAAGVYKELRDSQGGSGFSFADLAADLAGTRLGERATRSASAAAEVQARLAGRREARLFFPEVADLPESLGDEEFRRRFGGVEAPAYRQRVEAIERRIDALPLYKD